jgi:hypothetical protein
MSVATPVMSLMTMSVVTMASVVTFAMGAPCL